MNHADKIALAIAVLILGLGTTYLIASSWFEFRKKLKELKENDNG